MPDLNERQSGSLGGRGIVVTRPLEQAQHLKAEIERHGGKAILFPVLEIVEAQDLAPIHALIDRLDEFDIGIFISPTAVDKAMNLIRARRELPRRMLKACIGRASLRELRACGVQDAIAPAAQFDSEHLLAMDEFASVAGKRIVIFRGDGGRELLGDELAKRGAIVEYAECYRRVRPNVNAGPLLYGWARGEISAVTVTSGEGMHNLFDLVGKLGQQWLKKTPLFVPHARIAETAAALGLAKVIVTPPGDEGLLQGLLDWSHNG